MQLIWGVLLGHFPVLILGALSVNADLTCSLNDRAAIETAGGTIIGDPEFVSGEQGNGIRLGSNAYLTFPADRHFDPLRGTVEFWVRPLWSGDDQKDHSFFHMGGGDSHFTIFKTSGGSLRFVYKADPAHWIARDVDVSSWKPDQWHYVQASWIHGYSERLLLLLQVDGQTSMQSGALPLDEVPPVFFLGRRGKVGQPAEAAFDGLRLNRDVLESPYTTEAKRDVVANVDAASIRPLRNVHDCTTIWNSRNNPLPFSKDDAYFRRFVQAGFRMARLVAFSEGWLWGTRVELGQDGELLTDFQDFDRLVDTMLAAGAEPYIRLAYHTPSVLTEPGLSRKQRSYALPQDLGKWDELMERIVRHVRVERQLPVRYWVAALNEGDIPVLKGNADFATVNQLYERTALIVKRLDPEAKVGGPALAFSVGAGESHLRSFLQYCRERDLPLDFLCFHAYHRSHPREFEEVTDEIRLMVEEEWPERADHLEYFLDEWSLWNRDATQDNEYGASYLAAALHYQRRAGLTKSSIVSFNHFIPTEKPFVYNDEAILRYVGLPLIKGPVVTAPYFVWLMHNRLGHQEIGVELPGNDGILDDDSGGLTATTDGENIILLLWHFDLLRNEPRQWTIHLANLPDALQKAENIQLTEYRIDHDHTNPYTDYVLKGKDSQDGRYNLETGTLEKVRAKTYAGSTDTITVQAELPNLSVTLLELRPL